MPDRLHRMLEKDVLKWKLDLHKLSKCSVNGRWTSTRTPLNSRGSPDPSIILGKYVRSADAVASALVNQKYDLRGPTLHKAEEVFPARPCCGANVDVNGHLVVHLFASAARIKAYV